MNELMKAEKGRNTMKGRASRRETGHYTGGVRNPPVGSGETPQWLRALAALNYL